mmetsp:Transcript_72420/g.155042  ORF Transcript_72420/g.155042 Transcript_72420/m.155042 type:complete len:228 (-) Transcript_72420:1690-2373(-)
MQTPPICIAKARCTAPSTADLPTPLASPAPAQITTARRVLKCCNTDQTSLERPRKSSGAAGTARPKGECNSIDAEVEAARREGNLGGRRPLALATGRGVATPKRRWGLRGRRTLALPLPAGVPSDARRKELSAALEGTNRMPSDLLAPLSPMSLLQKSLSLAVVSSSCWLSVLVVGAKHSEPEPLLSSVTSSMELPVPEPVVAGVTRSCPKLFRIPAATPLLAKPPP